MGGINTAEVTAQLSEASKTAMSFLSSTVAAIGEKVNSGRIRRHAYYCRCLIPPSMSLITCRLYVFFFCLHLILLHHVLVCFTVVGKGSEGELARTRARDSIQQRT